MSVHTTSQIDLNQTKQNRRNGERDRVECVNGLLWCDHD